MMVEANFIEAGEALVTVNGLAYGGNLYSCQVAVREQWFANRSEERQFKIKVYVDEIEPTYLWLKHQDTFIQCHLIAGSEQITDGEKEQYYRKLQQIKRGLLQASATSEICSEKPQA